MKIALIALLAPALLCADDSAFNGKWNITVDGGHGRVWWLKITGAGTEQIAGEFVGAPGGGLDPIPELIIHNGELWFAFRRHYRGEDRESRQQGYYTARFDNGKLVGTFQVEGDPQVTEWTGIPAPEIDDSSSHWTAGKPIELFNGRDLAGWHAVFPERGNKWKVVDGILRNASGTSDISTDRKFWNFKLHAEYRVGEHSNAGIGLRGRYEVQILDDYGKPASNKGNGAIYSRLKPSTNASKPVNEWQTVDVTLIGRKVTVTLNGVEIIPEQVIEGFTAIATDIDEASPGPIQIQGDHGSVEYRKITLTPLERSTS